MGNVWKRSSFALSAVWVIVGSAEFVWHAFELQPRLTSSQNTSLFVFSGAVVYASALAFQLLKDGPRVDLNRCLQPDSMESAIEYCKQEVCFYETVGRYNFQAWRILLTTSIVAGAVSTVLSALPWTSKWLLIVRAAITAFVTIATALNSSYRLQQESVRQGSAADALRGELMKFATSSDPYHRSTSVSDFVTRVRAIVAAENHTWVLASRDTGSLTPAHNPDSPSPPLSSD